MCDNGDVSALQYELRESHSEIERHHRDFVRVRDVLDQWDRWSRGDWRDGPNMRAALKQIRNVVG